MTTMIAPKLQDANNLHPFLAERGWTLDEGEMILTHECGATVEVTCLGTVFDDFLFMEGRCSCGEEVGFVW